MIGRRGSVIWPMAALAVLAAAAAGPAAAEGVSGSDRMLCAAQHVTLCAPFAECSVVSPLDWELPDFVVVDVAAKTLSTTAANERQRSSPVRFVERANGRVFLQGFENERAFSILIVEETGEMSAAVTKADLNLSIYGICTPLPVGKAGGG